MKLKWEEMTPLEFENLCYDLLYELGFQNLNRRGGTADRGRDIEAIWEIRDPSGDIHLQEWLVECKFFKKGIPVRELHEKIQWADVEKPDVLLLITNSHLTAQAKDWLREIRDQKVYSIRIWEHEKIEKLLLKHPSILEKYFRQPDVEIDFEPYLLSIIEKNQEIMEFYVPLNISYQVFSGEEKITTIDELIERFHKLILIGEFGSGKTMTLRYLAYSYARRFLSKGEDFSLIPIYIELRFLEKRRIPDIIFEKINLSIPNAGKSLIGNYLSQGKFIVLLDGLDELYHYGTRVDYIQDFLNVFCRNKFVLSSRQFPNIDTTLMDVTVGRILPLDHKELMARFLEISESIPPAKLKRLSELYRAQKSSSTEELLKEHPEHFLEKSLDDREDYISPEIQSNILSRIALESHVSERALLPEIEIKKIIRACLLETFGEKGLRYSEIGILNYLISSNILIRRDGKIGFSHGVLQQCFYENGLIEERRRLNKELRPTYFKETYLNFENMINLTNLREIDYQRFLAVNPWFFGGEYINAYSQKRAGAELIVDFLLRRYDGFHDIAEIKRPNHEVFVGPDINLKPSAACMQGISRIMDYLDYYERNVQEEYWKTGKEIYKPRGIVVVGRSQDTDKRKLRQLNSYVSSIEVWTYDDLLLKSQALIDLLERKKNTWNLD